MTTEVKTISETEAEKNVVWEAAAKGLGTAAKWAAMGFAGAIVGGVKLTTKVIIPAAAKGVSDAIAWGRKKDEE